MLGTKASRFTGFFAAAKEENGAFGMVLYLMNGLGSIMVLIVMLLITADVIARAAFNNPIGGVPELAAVMVPTMCYLQLTWVLRKGRFIQSGVLSGRVSAKTQEAVILFSGILGAVLFVMWAYAAWHPMWSSWASREFEGTVARKIPVYPIRTLIVLCAGLMCVQFTLNIVQSWKKLAAMKHKWAAI